MRIKKLFVLLCLFLATSFCAFSEEFSSEELECTDVVGNLVKSYLEENQLILSCFEDAAGKMLDIESLMVAERRDLDQGSLNLRRTTKLIDVNGNYIIVYTFGSFWCTDEQILGIKEIG